MASIIPSFKVYIEHNGARRHVAEYWTDYRSINTNAEAKAAAEADASQRNANGQRAWVEPGTIRKSDAFPVYG